MGKIIVSLLLIITLIFCISISGCTAMPSLGPSPASGPIHSDESNPISSTQNVNIIRSGDTITASGSLPYNIKTQHDPFLLKEGKATVTIDLQGNGFGSSIGLNYRRPGSQAFSLMQLYVMDSDRTMHVTKTVTLPYTGDYYLAVNWADSWTVTIVQ